MSTGLNILTVEDNPADLFMVERMLQSSRLEIENLYSAERVGQACQILETQDIHLVLLDLTLPDSFGINSFLHLKPLVQKIPVIILSGLPDTKLALDAIKEGAQDYLIKGEFDSQLLEKSMQYSLERKRNLESLRVSNERFNTVATATNDVIWDWDLETNEVFVVGDAYKRLFGYDIVNSSSPKEFWEGIIHPEDKDRVLEKLGRTIGDGTALKWEDEYRMRRRDGDYAFVHNRGQIIYSADQRPVRVIGAIQDITIRRRSEEKIRASEEKYKRIFYRNPFPTWIYDLNNFQIMEVNDAAVKKYGFGKQEFLQMTMRDIYVAAQVEPFLQDVAAIASGGNPSDRKLWHHLNKKRDVMIVEVTSLLIDYNGKESMQVIVNDVTERIRLEKELQMQQKLKQQQITEVVLGAQERERFELGQELHDNINQILATSKLYLDVAIEESEPRIELLTKSRKNISMAIEEIRKLSKELITPTLNDLGLVQSIKELIRGIQGIRKMRIRLNISGLDEHSLEDEQKITIYRIIQEQLNNILKHAQATTVLIELNQHRLLHQISLLVQDDGVGFDPCMQRNGVGISNIISRAELYNGQVDIDSAPGKGCKLEVVLNSKEMKEVKS